MVSVHDYDLKYDRYELYTVYLYIMYISIFN